jgi:hypothetical protein
LVQVVPAAEHAAPFVQQPWLTPPQANCWHSCEVELQTMLLVDVPDWQAFPCVQQAPPEAPHGEQYVPAAFSVWY